MLFSLLSVVVIVVVIVVVAAAAAVVVVAVSRYKLTTSVFWTAIAVRPLRWTISGPRWQQFCLLFVDVLK